MKFSITKFFILCITFTFIMGCASYKPVMSTNDVYKDKKIDNRIVASKNDISIDLIPIKNRRIANEYLGIDPYSTEILPVLIKIKNNGSDYVKVNLNDLYIISNEGKIIFSLPVYETVNRLRRTDDAVSKGMAFGLLGVMASSADAVSYNKSVDMDFHKKNFKPTIIGIQKEAQGLVFFDYPQSVQGKIQAFVFSLTTLNRKETVEFKLKIDNEKVFN